MEDAAFLGCVSCMNTNDLYDLFAVYEDNDETYAKMLETCFDIKVSNDMKFLCAICVQRLEEASAFKNQTARNLSMLQNIKDEEYLDENILEEVDSSNGKSSKLHDLLSDEDEYDFDDDESILNSDMLLDSSKGVTSEGGFRKYPCHFCDNVYKNKKACFTHLRMKHGLKLCNEQPLKPKSRERKKCYLCNRDFSQKQLLDKHLMKAHGLEVEKRKAFICPLCDERVSYGSQFSLHLQHAHKVHEQVEELEFHNMDDFLVYKSAIQEETKARFRKTTASKQTIEGLRSHYMCSQSGVYVYQGKGKRPAPERQIYKTGKACPAHMIVTETLRRVRVLFYATHVGHGVCPYYEPRETKKAKPEATTSIHVKSENEIESNPDSSEYICDTCGAPFSDGGLFRQHVMSHGVKLFPCQYCDNVFQNLDAWTCHIKVEHNIGAIF